MNLQFINKGGNFVSEFEVTSDFNLHIEGVRLSDMHIYQKTAGGSYAKVTDFPSERSQDRVADFDFASLVYPKFIKVVCATEPTYAEIATDGEVTEIKSQSKEVEITANGVTEIAPDNGFGYLSGVKVNVNVPQSGGGDTPSGESGEKYYVPSAEMAGLGIYGSLCKCVSTQDRTFYGIVPPAAYLAGMGSLDNLMSSTVAISINLDKKIVTTGIDSPIMTIKELLSLQFGIDITSVLTEITEEEFYDVNNLHE